MKTFGIENVVNGKRAFISQLYAEFDTSNFFIISNGDYRYLHEQIFEDVNMNNKKIINCYKGVDEKDMCTIKIFYSVLYKRINFKYV